jgi:tRNA(Arg) A34 adenosine deaminase TadA
MYMARAVMNVDELSMSGWYGRPAMSDESAAEAWAALSRMWQVAFEQAWLSFRDGNFGIGAVLVDPVQDNAVVAFGRNLVVGPLVDDQRIAGNYMAHAEMNVFATMSTYDARGLHLYTTLEPCLMCAATAMFLNVERVHFPVGDEYFEPSMNDVLWPSHPYTQDRMPHSTHVDLGRLGSFARLLPLSHTMATVPGSRMADVARQRRPLLTALAEDAGTTDAMRDAAAVDDVLAGLILVWERLPQSEP